MPVAQPKKLLRIGVFQGKQCIEERLIRRRETVSFGQNEQNSFVILSSSMPVTHQLFVYESKNDSYYLCVEKSMGGRVALPDGKIIELRKIDEAKQAKKVGDLYRIQLNDRSRGRVVIGKIVVLFQFVNPPDEAVGAMMLQSKGGGLFGRLSEFIGLGFAICLLLSLLIHIVPLLYVVLQDWPRNDEELIMIPSWFLEHEAVVQVEEEEPDELVQEGEGDEGMGEDAVEDVAPTKTPAPPSDAKALRAARQESGKKIVAGILGVDGGDGLSNIGADILGSAGTVSAFEGLSRDDIGGPGSGGTGMGLNLGSGGSSTGEAGLKSLGTGGASDAVVGSTTQGVKVARERVQIKMSDDTSIPTSVEASDKSALEAAMAKKKIDIERCYQRVIQEHGQKPGRLVARITIGKDGSVMKVEITEDQIGSGLTACVQAKIKRWKFPTLDRPVTLMKRWIFG
ncbi:MAG: AgmX/PglI C-terminal domain-containing protein [Bradymonadales bacterium]|jgi:hypothetical protein